MEPATIMYVGAVSRKTVRIALMVTTHIDKLADILNAHVQALVTYNV